MKMKKAVILITVEIKAWKSIIKQVRINPKNQPSKNQNQGKRDIKNLINRGNIKNLTT